MIDMNTYLWEGLFVIKQMYDHGAADDLLKEFADQKLDSDLYGEICYSALFGVFEDTRSYFNEDQDTEIFVFFDPVIDWFYETCRMFEAHTGIRPEENTHRKALERELGYALSVNDYSYDHYSHTDQNSHGRCRLVLRLFCEFSCLHEVPGGLLDARDAFRQHTEQMCRELDTKRGSVIAFPGTKSELEAA